MIKEDFSACPKCDFPAIYSEFMKFENDILCNYFQKIPNKLSLFSLMIYNYLFLLIRPQDC